MNRYWYRKPKEETEDTYIFTDDNNTISIIGGYVNNNTEKLNKLLNYANSLDLKFIGSFTHKYRVDGIKNADTILKERYDELIKLKELEE